MGVLEVWLVVSFLACSLLPIYLATAARPTSSQKVAQALVFGWIFITALPVLLGSARKRVTGPVLAVYGVMVLFAVPAITQRYFRFSWFVGDVLLLSTPALLGLALHSVSEVRPDWPKKALQLTIGTLFVAAVVGSFFPDPYDHNRYSPPAPLLMAAVWVYLLPKRGAKRMAALVGIPIVAVLTWNSQWRSSMMVFLFIGVVTLLFLLRGHGRMFVGLFVTGAAIVALGLGVNLQPGPGQSNNRIVETFQEGGLRNDSSTMFRFTEAQAVERTVKDEWILPNVLVGGGHGATYNIFYLSSLPESHRFEERNGSDGRVHNIHLGVVMLAYRYGMAGIGLVLFFLLLAARGWWCRRGLAIMSASWLRWRSLGALSCTWPTM